MHCGVGERAVDTARVEWQESGSAPIAEAWVDYTRPGWAAATRLLG